MLRTLHNRNIGWRTSGLFHHSTNDELNQEMISLVNKFVEMRARGTITAHELETLVRLVLGNYVESEVESQVDDLLKDRLADLYATSYA